MNDQDHYEKFHISLGTFKPLNWSKRLKASTAHNLMNTIRQKIGNGRKPRIIKLNFAREY